jgi:hypothetical protein
MEDWAKPFQSSRKSAPIWHISVPDRLIRKRVPVPVILREFSTNSQAGLLEIRSGKIPLRVFASISDDILPRGKRCLPP